MEQQIFDALISRTYRASEFHDVVMLLKAFWEEFFFSGESSTKQKPKLHLFLEEHTAPDHIKKIVEELPTSFFDQVSAKTVYSTVDILLEKVEHIPSIALYVPVELTAKQYANIGMWARVNIAKGVLLDIKIDPSLAGGCAIVWNGIYHNFSLQYFIEKKRRDIISMIHSFQHESANDKK